MQRKIFIFSLISVVAVECVSLHFDWLNDQASIDGIPLLAITDVETKIADEAILRLENPPCSFAGHLKNNPSVRVRVAGGCPFEDEYLIEMKAGNGKTDLFKVNGNQGVRFEVEWAAVVTSTTLSTTTKTTTTISATKTTTSTRTTTTTTKTSSTKPTTTITKILTSTTKSTTTTSTTKSTTTKTISTSTTTKTTSTTTVTTTSTTKTTTTTTVTTSTTTASTTTLTPAAVCKCGNIPLPTPSVGRDLDERIVGGFVATPHSVPYQIGLWLTIGSSPFCGGTLISPNYVLTAAHCIITSASNMKLSLGDVNYKVIGDGEILGLAQTTLVHPNYNSVTNDFDFALIQLKSPAQITTNVSLACLPMNTPQDFSNESMAISGWGRISQLGIQSASLKAGYVTGMLNAECNNLPAYNGTIFDSMICASSANMATDTCQGDSGGPMAALVNGKVTIAGITSFGQGCGVNPGVYSRVTVALDWILANSDAGYCQN